MTNDEFLTTWREWLDRKDVLAIKKIANYWDMSVKVLLKKLIDVNALSKYKPDEHHKDRLTSAVKWFLEACQYDATKTVCPLCLKLNLSYDDVGYFYSNEHISRIKCRQWIDPLDRQPETPYIPNCCEEHRTAER